jgi:hypothetical protein
VALPFCSGVFVIVRLLCRARKRPPTTAARILLRLVGAIKSIYGGHWAFIHQPLYIEIAFDIIRGVIATLGVVCGGQTETVRAVAGAKECGTVGARWFQCRNSLIPARGLKLSVISLGQLISFKNCRNSVFPARGLKLAMRTLAAKISSHTLHPCSLAVVQLQIVTIVQKKLKSIHGSYTTAQTRNHGRLPNP